MRFLKLCLLYTSMCIRDRSERFRLFCSICFTLFSPHSFTAEATIPCSRYSCPQKNTSTAGIKVTTEEVNAIPASFRSIFGRYKDRGQRAGSLRKVKMCIRDRVYLVGCLFPHTNECWGFRQWLTESPLEERLLLERVIAFCRDFSCLIHFNGSRFDLPFLHKRSEKLGLKDSFLTMDGLDLYQNIKKCKNLCGLTNVKQKSVEQFLNIERDDQYGGGELIPIYHQFIKTGNPKLLRCV